MRGRLRQLLTAADVVVLRAVDAPTVVVVHDLGELLREARNTLLAASLRVKSHTSLLRRHYLLWYLLKEAHDRVIASHGAILAKQ